MKLFYYLLIAACFLACSSKKEKKDKSVQSSEVKYPADKTQELVSQIQNAHKKNFFELSEVIQFDLSVTFKGKKSFEGRVYMTTDGKLIKMEDGMKLMYWDGEKAMTLPNREEDLNARSTLLTWAYFFMTPYKLNDPGTIHESLGLSPLNGSDYIANKLTFGSNIGDNPDDWYIIYKGNNDLLAAMAYIVTGENRTQQEAEKAPHAITYEAFIEVNEIPISTLWNFWTWNKEGKLEKLIGTAQISNIHFIKKAGDIFYLPASSTSNVDVPI